MFSLSSDGYAGPENGGVVGVSGTSSETSDGEVVQLIGVLADDIDERLGVTGSATSG